MCSCSGSCNCNSTTIPRGPQGIQGNTGPVGPVSTVPGPPGDPGDDGIDGLNAFTTLTDDFVQPAVDATVTIHVVDATWVAVDSIIFVESSSTTDAGGYYQVVFASNLPTPTIVIKNLGWIIPGTVFVSPASAVGEIGTLVVAAGTIGATGPQGLAGAVVIDAQWDSATNPYLTPGGINALKTSILVPGNTLTVSDDVLDCQTIFKIAEGIPEDDYIFYIKVSPDNTMTNATVAIYVNVGVNLITRYDGFLHINYKIQRIPAQGAGDTRFRTKGEIFFTKTIPNTPVSPGVVDTTWTCTSIDILQLASNTTWGNTQYVVAGANDFSIPYISVLHHEVKLAKK